MRSLLADPETGCSDLNISKGKHDISDMHNLDDQSEYLTSTNSSTAVFIDTGVIDYQSLQAGVLPGIDAVIISSDEDAIA